MDYILRRKFLNNNPQISTLKLNKIGLHYYLIKNQDFFYHRAKKVSYLLTLLFEVYFLLIHIKNER